MYSIHLHKLIFKAYHGLFPEEKILGNEFEVNIDISIKNIDNVSSIEDTVNYVDLYNIIKEEMSVPNDLLESLAASVCHRIHQYDSRITEISFNIKKLHPPVSGFQGNVGITLQKSF